MSSDENVRARDVIELPGVGEIRARPGTSTMELAGAASFWAKKYKSARKDGFVAGVTLMATLNILCLIAYTFIRSR